MPVISDIIPVIERLIIYKTNIENICMYVLALSSMPIMYFPVADEKSAHIRHIKKYFAVILFILKYFPDIIREEITQKAEDDKAPYKKA